MKKKLLKILIATEILGFSSLDTFGYSVVHASENEAISYFADIENLSAVESGDGEHNSLYLIGYFYDESNCDDLIEKIGERFVSAASEEWFDYEYVMIDLWGSGYARFFSYTYETKDIWDVIQIKDWESNDMPDIFCYNDLYAEYIDSEVMTSDEGNVLVVHYEFENSGEKSVAFNRAFSDKCFLNGVELDECYQYNSSEYENRSKEIRPGTTIKVDSAFWLENGSGEIIIEVSPWLEDEVVFEKELTLNGN